MVSKAGVVVFDNVYKKVLTISNQFDANIGLPKGSIENGEDSYNAAFRELYEETGIKFDNKPEIVSEFINRNCDCKFYVIYLPKASCKEISWKVETENIFHIKWRTLEELITNKQLVNYTFKNRNKNIISYISNLFTNKKSFYDNNNNNINNINNIKTTNNRNID